MNAAAKIYTVHPGGYLQCATYLVDGPGGAILVDPGSGADEAGVLEGIQRTGHRIEDVGYALLTHCHVDHALGAYRFRERGVKLVASPRTAEILRTGGHQVWYEFPDCVIPTEVDIAPADGEVLELAGLRIAVLHTPGHTDGCASYLVRTAEGLAAFTGDLICGNGHPGWAGSEGFSLEATLRSIEKLIGQKPDKAFWGHGAIPGRATLWLHEALRLGKSGQWRTHAERHPDMRPPDSLLGRRRG